MPNLARSSCFEITQNFSLYLNIWVPGNANVSSNMPVKFWIYGGFELSGSTSDPLYDGCNLATDAIVVSAAYRLGSLGFMALDSAGIGGNMGVQDLLLALQWVQDNIAAFGGDAASLPPCIWLNAITNNSK
jgi:carboxylesterase type B